MESKCSYCLLLLGPKTNTDFYLPWRVEGWVSTVKHKLQKVIFSCQFYIYW